uniref:Cyclic nucleotide-gated ion channel 1 n=1 Tax=Solanum tuberosum TaxID=4113 RepID=M1BIZ0_SOLTU
MVLNILRFEDWKSEQSSFSIDHKSSSNIRPFHVRKPSVASNKIVLNPHSRILQKWNKVCILVCAFAVSLDPLFLYIPVIDNKNKCLDLDKKLKNTACVLHSITDIFSIIHIILKFRTAVIAPYSRVYGNTLIDDSSAIAKRYFVILFQH